MTTYSEALKNYGFQENPAFICDNSSDPHANEKRKCGHLIIWLNPSYSMNVKINISKAILSLGICCTKYLIEAQLR